MAKRSVSPRQSRGKKRETPLKPGSRMERFKPWLPYEDFPLFPVIDKKRGDGRWAKKFNRRLHYYGKLSDGWKPALEAYEKFRDYDATGRRRPTDDAEGVTVRHLVNQYLALKESRLDSGELKRRTFDEHKAACAMIVDEFGRNMLVADLTPADFGKLRAKLAKRFAPVTMANWMQRIRSIFKFGFDDGLLDKPVRFGQSFKRPSMKTIRQDKNTKPVKLFTPEEVRQFIDAADPPLDAMVLLGVNCAMGVTDLAELEFDHLDLDAGTIDYARGKTGVQRRAVLWPETIAALRVAIERRPDPKDNAHAGRVFITKYGNPWLVEGERHNSISLQFGKLRKACGAFRKGVGFYALRHSFRTAVDGLGDRPAIDMVMGHEASNDIATHYRHNIDDARLRAVADYVHRWLFGSADEAVIGKIG